MRVLVTGGAGFIGSHLVDALIEQGHTVTILDDLSSGLHDRLAPGADLRRLDITDAAAMAALFDETGPEAVFHLAAQIDVRASVADPARDAAINIGGTVTLLEAARRTGARLVFASTGGALYGAEAPIPSPESVPPAPESPYGTAKYGAEQYLGMYNRLYGTRHSVLRLANVYGPRQSPGGEAGVVSIFCGRVARGERPTVYGDGKTTRDYVYVGDVVDAFLAAAQAPAPGVWNIGTGAETTVLQLADLIGRIAGRAVDPVFAPARPGELQRSALEVSAARRDLGWQAKVPLAEGVRRVYEWVTAGHPPRAPR